MTNARLFTAAFRQNLQIVVILIGTVLLLGFTVSPIDSLAKLGWLSALLLAATTLCISLIKSVAKTVRCSTCSTELYTFHEQFKHMNYCPTCGNPVPKKHNAR